MLNYFLKAICTLAQSYVSQIRVIQIYRYTSLESTAAYIMSIHPLNVAF